MVIFNSYVSLPEGTICLFFTGWSAQPLVRVQVQEMRTDVSNARQVQRCFEKVGNFGTDTVWHDELRKVTMFRRPNRS